MAPTYPLPCVTDGKSIRVNNNLTVAFHRTTAVPDDNKTYSASVLRGQYSLNPISEYQDAFEAGATGVFLPMREHDTLSVHFVNTGRPYLVRIYAGEVNVLTGRLATDADRTSDMREQDYIVVKTSATLGGLAETRHVGRQFVAMPNGSGSAIELDNPTQGLRFEITPLESGSRSDRWIRINTPKERNVYIPGNYTAKLMAKAKLKRFFGFPEAGLREMKVMLRDAEIEEGMSIDDVGWKPSPMHPVRLEYKKPFAEPHAEAALQVRGLRDPRIMFHMGSPHENIPDLDTSEKRPSRAIIVGVGGRIQQEIAYDAFPPLWNPAKITVLEVHVVSHEGYMVVTGQAAPAPFAPGQGVKRMEFKDYEIRNLEGPLTEFYCVRDDNR